MANRILRLVVVAFLSSAIAYCLQLKKETLNAWNAYVAQVNAQTKQRAGANQIFLWVDHSKNLYHQVHDGEIAVEPIAKQNPQRVPAGLIHHWIGVIFIPGATMQDVLAITRDYARYKDYYKPGVADASLEKRSEFRDEFSIRFSNPSVLSSTTLLGEYFTDFVALNETRGYSTSETTSMCDIKNFGEPNQKRLPPDTGSGYIWRLFSTARMEDRDGGVILELETVALSREIPAALHWFVDPIVRRISRDSMEKSLRQTSEAVLERLKNCATGHPIIESAHCSTHADHPDFRAQKLAGHSVR